MIRSILQGFRTPTEADLPPFFVWVVVCLGMDVFGGERLLLSREVAHMPTKCVQVDVPKEYLQIDAWLEFCRPSCTGPYWAA